MSSNPKTVEIDGIPVAVTEEVYRAFKRPVWAERKRKEREQRCRDENGNRCMKSCKDCLKLRDGTPFSIEFMIEKGIEVADPTDVEEIVAYHLLLDELYAALSELEDEESSLIGAIFFDGKSERQIAGELGLSQKAVNKRRHRILAKLFEKMTGK
jgi:RNA polymerase sigma factor (sigma-70 family)